MFTTGAVIAVYDRSRSIASTADEPGGVALLGSVGTVERCGWFGAGDDWGRDDCVVWDGLLPRLLVHHDPEELELAEA